MGEEPGRLILALLLGLLGVSAAAPAQASDETRWSAAGPWQAPAAAPAPADTIDPPLPDPEPDPPPQRPIDPALLVDPDTIPSVHGLTRLRPDFDTIQGVDREFIAEMAERAARQPSAIPRLPDGAPRGSHTGVWEWGRSELLVARALNLEELLRQVPGVTTLRTGDYGNPAAATAFGLDGGRVRLYVDGFELAPMEAAVVDLSQVPLAGLDRVRVERRLGELRVELRTLESQEPDPYTFVQAGTGDLSTDFFRGAFAHPQVMGGQASLALERLATRGTARAEPGSQLGLSFRYSVHRGEESAVALEFRRGSVNRFEGVFEGVAGAPELSRTDWTLRGRHRFAEGLVAEAFAGGASVSAGEGGAEALEDLSRRQAGVRAGLERDRYWGRVTLRGHTGDGWPSYRAEATAGLRWRLGGGELHLGREGWSGADGAFSARAGVWTAPLLGFSLFAQAEDGTVGVPFLPRAEEEEGDDEGEDGDEGVGAAAPASVLLQAEGGDGGAADAVRFTERSGLRVGGRFERGPVGLTGAYLLVEADSLHPLGLPPEGEGVVVPGGRVNGVEVSGRLPVPLLEGLSVEGAYTEWLRGDRFRYVPGRSWSARLGYHNVFLESRSLELWADVGAQGRDAMTVPAAGVDGEGALEAVPSALEWSLRVQVRVQSVRAFVHWDNLTFRTGNRDFPGRNLPGGRATWGIRWTMWN